jgi:hypothetical protein
MRLKHIAILVLSHLLLVTVVSSCWLFDCGGEKCAFLNFKTSYHVVDTSNNMVQALPDTGAINTTWDSLRFVFTPDFICGITSEEVRSMNISSAYACSPEIVMVWLNGITIIADSEFKGIPSGQELTHLFGWSYEWGDMRDITEITKNYFSQNSSFKLGLIEEPSSNGKPIVFTFIFDIKGESEQLKKKSKPIIFK